MWEQLFEKDFKEDAFLVGAFGLDQDIEAYLDDPESGIGDGIWDNYQEELNDLLIPNSEKRR